MNQTLKRILYFLLGLCGLLSLLCSVAASLVTNASLMNEGFLQFSQTSHLGVPPSRYGDYAAAVTDYLDGKTDAIQVLSSDGERKNAFSDKENAHMRDVRSIISALKWVRWLGGSGVILIAGLLYVLKKQARDQFLRDMARGFACAAIVIVALALGLGIWGLVNFRGLFWMFHKVVFSNDLWLLDPQTDLLMALMPLPFFTWYAGQIIKSLLPILGVMGLVIIAYFKTKDRA